MKSIGPVRFTAWVILTVIGAVLITTEWNDWGILATCSGLLLVSKADWKVKYSTEDTLAFILPLLLFPFVFLWVPPERLKAVAQHPLVVYPLWSLVLFRTFQSWKNAQNTQFKVSKSDF